MTDIRKSTRTGIFAALTLVVWGFALASSALAALPSTQTPVLQMLPATSEPCSAAT